MSMPKNSALVKPTETMLRVAMAYAAEIHNGKGHDAALILASAKLGVSKGAVAHCVKTAAEYLA